MIKHYKIWFIDGTSIVVREFNWYAGEQNIIVVKREDVVEDKWKYFEEKNITKIYFISYSVTRIEEMEVETR